MASAGLVAAGFPVSGASLRTAVFVAVVALSVVVTWVEPVRLAWVVGFFLPIQQLQDVPLNVPQFMGIVMVGLVALGFRADLEGDSRRTVVRFLVGLAAMVAVQTVFGVFRDPLLSSLRFNGLYAVTLIAAGLVVFRVAAHRPLLIGHLAGTAFSSIVALGQAAGWNPIAVNAWAEGRFQGFALEAPGLSWHAAVAIPLAAFVIWTTESRRVRWAAWAGLVLCTLGLIVCGAQGGLVGLVVSGALCLVIAWRQFESRALARAAIRAAGIGAAVLIVAAGLAWAAGLGLSSLTGIAGDPVKGYENERARGRAIEYGIEQLVDQPLTGIGNVAYEQRYDVRPHVLALNLSVNTGVLGLVIGIGLMAQVMWVAIRGSTSSWPPERWLATVFLITLFVHACLTPSGPFARIERLTVLLIAMAVASGGAPGLGRPSHRGDLVSQDRPTDIGDAEADLKKGRDPARRR